MQIWESVAIALRGLTVNKLRTFLTMLGVIIGVASVIALLSIGKGFEKGFSRQIESMGVNVLWIIPGNHDIFNEGGDGSSSREARRRPKSPEPLTMGDVETIADPVFVPDVVAIAPEYTGNPNTVTRGQREMDSSITGVVPDYQGVHNVTLVMGDFISQAHVDRRARVAVLGSGVASELFEAYEYPLGQTIKLNGTPFEVIGVLAEKERGIFGEENNKVLIPITAAQTRLYSAGAFRGDLIVPTIYVQVARQDRMEAVSSHINVSSGIK